MESDWSGDEITCEIAWVLIQGFVSGDSTPDSERLMRAHTAQCEDCREEYRSAVVTTARIGGEQRRKRVADEREQRHQRLRRMAFQATAPPAGRFHRLRTLLYPAFFAFLMFQVSRVSLAVAGVSVTGLAGQVTVGDECIELDDESRLERGEWCETEADSSARLEAGTCVALLGASSALQIERAMPARFRLARGQVALDGTGTLSTGWGVLDLKKARARVTLMPEGMQVEDVEGAVTLTGPDGATLLEPGGVHRRGF